jgi:hypothetical protein
MARYGRTTRIQRFLLMVGIVLFVLGIAITVGIPPIEALPDLPDPGSVPGVDLPEWSDLLGGEDGLNGEDLPVDRGNLPLID